MNYFYNEDFILERKNEEDDDEDDGLLKNGIKKKKKENPLYKDYKNKQIMNGKVVKSEEGWKQENKRKKFLKRALAVGGTLAIAAGAHHSIKKKNDPAYAENCRYKKKIAAYNKEREKLAEKNGRKQARIENKFLNKTNSKIAKQNRDEKNKEINDEIRERRKQTNAGGFFNNIKNIFKTNESYEAFLYNNYTLEDFIEYNYYYNESEDTNAYNRYADKFINKGEKPPMSYKEWKKHKKHIKRKIIKNIAGIGIAATAAADLHGRYKGKGGLIERANRQKLKLNASKYKRIEGNRNKIKNDLINNEIEMQRNDRNAFAEELYDISPYDMKLYLETIYTDYNFNKKSYDRYCIMMESKNLIPLDEDAFSDAKEKLASYTNAAINGIKTEKRKKEEELRKKEKAKEEKEKEERKKEKAKLEKMTLEERKEYLRKKKKAELKREEIEQDAHDLKQTFKQAFVRGSGEHLGQSAAKIITKLVSK